MNCKRMYKTTEITSAEIASDNPVHQRLLFPYVEAANLVSGKVLEIGCGWGRGLELLTKAAKHYTGIDKKYGADKRIEQSLS